MKRLFRLIGDIVLSNAVYRARVKSARWAAGAARDPHYKLTADKPGARSPVLELVERVVSDLQDLENWKFNPPIELQELDAKLNPTSRTTRLSRLDENIRGAFKRARSELLSVRCDLRDATRRPRGRKARLVKPFRVSAFSRASALPKPARRRELVRMLREGIFALHPDRKKRPRAARAYAGRLAHDIIDSIPLLVD